MSVDPTNVLPDPVMKHVLSFLPVQDVERCRWVSKPWKAAAESDEVWRNLFPEVGQVPQGSTVRQHVVGNRINELSKLGTAVGDFSRSVANDSVGEFACVCLHDRSARVDCTLGRGDVTEGQAPATRRFVLLTARPSEGKGVASRSFPNAADDQGARGFCSVVFSKLLVQKAQSQFEIYNSLKKKVQVSARPRATTRRCLAN